MKKLVLVRHAKAVNNGQDISDFERSLVKEGRKASAKMASRLRKAGFQPDFMISSPANRALETAHIFAEAFDYPIQKILLRDIIYEASSVEPFIHLINELDVNIDNVIFFGHNPSVSEFAALLLGNFERSMPKSAVLEIAIDRVNWQDIQPGDGRLANFDIPKNKKDTGKLRKSSNEELSDIIGREIKDRLSEYDSEAADKIDKKINKYAQKIVQEFIKKSK